jgi:hypothetical protein
MTLFQVKVLLKKFTLLHADFSKIVLKYSNKVHLLCYLTPLPINYSVSIPIRIPVRTLFVGIEQAPRFAQLCNIHFNINYCII